VRRKFIHILDTLESDGMTGEETIDLEEEMHSLERLNAIVKETMSLRDPKSQLKSVSNLPKQKTAKPNPETRSFTARAYSALEAYSFNEAGVIEKRVVPFPAVQTKGVKRGVKPASPPGKKGKKEKQAAATPPKKVSTQELIQIGVAEEISFGWALVELKKLNY
jgi:hypothetical protein